MQIARLALLALFGAALLAILHEHAQNNRYQANSETPTILDTRTGAMYRLSNSPTGTKAELISEPLQ